MTVICTDTCDCDSADLKLFFVCLLPYAYNEGYEHQRWVKFDPARYRIGQEQKVQELLDFVLRDSLHPCRAETDFGWIIFDNPRTEI